MIAADQLRLVKIRNKSLIAGVDELVARQLTDGFGQKPVSALPGEAA